VDGAYKSLQRLRVRLLECVKRRQLLAQREDQ
jgi:hypothetical protein